MAQAHAQPRTRLLTVFAGASLGVLAVAVLYFVQTIFIPLALAVFLTFLMSPVVDRLEWWIGRTVSAIAVMLMAVGLLVGVGCAVTHELGELVQTLSRPEYAQNIGEKVAFFRRWVRGGIVDEIPTADESGAGEGQGNPAERQW